LASTLCNSAHTRYDLAHSVDLLANEMRRRADLVYNFLEGESGQSSPNGHDRAGEHFEEIKAILRSRFEGWKAICGVSEDDAEEFAAAEKALHGGDHAAEEAISRLSSDGLAPALAKLIIFKGSGINLALGNEPVYDRSDTEAAAALDWFDLREQYDGYFPSKEEAASC
jgi:hypothetical protein